MKRSTSGKFYVTPLDFELACLGKKTASSRLGDRSEMWPVGLHTKLVNNEDEDESLFVEITYNVLMTLGDIYRPQAGAIGDYSVQDHWNDFTSVYPGSDRDTVISLVGFRVL